MIVLDANILIRAILGRRVRDLIETHESRGVRFLAPEIAFAEAERYLPALLQRRGMPITDLAPAIGYLRHLVHPVAVEDYAAFEEEARARLRGRDEEDWPVLATALAFHCPIWTEDQDFFGTGVATWITSRVAIYLRQQTPGRRSEP
jgi:predicted nucleic acid-binding protein